MSQGSDATEGVTANTSSSNIGSWAYLQQKSFIETAVGKSLEIDKEQRLKGRGEAHVSNTLRLFDKPDGYQPRFTLYRDEVRGRKLAFLFISFFRSYLWTIHTSTYHFYGIYPLFVCLFFGP
jgi:hypothetical protein